MTQVVRETQGLRHLLLLSPDLLTESPIGRGTTGTSASAAMGGDGFLGQLCQAPVPRPQTLEMLCLPQLRLRTTQGAGIGCRRRPDC